MGETVVVGMDGETVVVGMDGETEETKRKQETEGKEEYTIIARLRFILLRHFTFSTSDITKSQPPFRVFSFVSVSYGILYSAGWGGVGRSGVSVVWWGRVGSAVTLPVFSVRSRHTDQSTSNQSNCRQKSYGPSKRSIPFGPAASVHNTCRSTVLSNSQETEPV